MSAEKTQKPIEDQYLETIEVELVEKDEPKFLLVCRDPNTKDIIERVLQSSLIFDRSKQPYKVVTHKETTIAPTVETIILVVDNRGPDTSSNPKIASLIKHWRTITRNETTGVPSVIIKIAIPRRDKDTETCFYKELIDQSKGISKCARAIRGAVVIENDEEVSRLRDTIRPLQLILQRIVEERERIAATPLARETVAQRLHAATVIYDKGIEVDKDNVVGVNLWLRGITYIPPSFRAAILTHPDKSRDENRGTLESEDQWYGLSELIRSGNSFLNNRVVHYNGQYWKTTLVASLEGLLTIRLTNPLSSVTLSALDGKTILHSSPHPFHHDGDEVRVRDFKLYARVIPYYDAGGVFTGVERTFFANNAHQPSKERYRTKLARGLTNGSSAIFYGSDKPLFKIIGEGSENVLSALEVCRRAPNIAKKLGLLLGDTTNVGGITNCQFAAALGVSDVIKMPIEDSVRTIFLVVDNDAYNLETKHTMIDTVEHFLHLRGEKERPIEVKIIFAPAPRLGLKRDLNDVLREEGLEACSKLVSESISVTSKEQLGPLTEPLQLSLRLLSLNKETASTSQRLELGRIYLDLGRNADAYECYSRLTDRTMEVSIHRCYGFGMIQFRRKDFKAAQKNYSKALRFLYQTGRKRDTGRTTLELFTTPALAFEVEILVAIGYCHLEDTTSDNVRKSIDTAISYLTRAHDLVRDLELAQPARVNPYTCEARASLRQLESPSALESPSQQKHDETEGKSDALLGSVLVALGDAYLAANDRERSLFSYRKALSIPAFRNTPHIPQILEKIGDLYSKKGRVEEAIDYYEQTILKLNKLYCSERHGLDARLKKKIDSIRPTASSETVSDVQSSGAGTIETEFVPPELETRSNPLANGLHPRTPPPIPAFSSSSIIFKRNASAAKKVPPVCKSEPVCEAKVEPPSPTPEVQSKSALCLKADVPLLTAGLPAKEIRSTGSQLSLKGIDIAMLRDRMLNRRQIVIDLEMTGGLVEKDKITNIGCVVLDKGRRTGQTLNRYVNPEIPVRGEAYRLTGLSLGYLSRFPIFAIAVPEFLIFIQNSDLVFHARQKDLEFLKKGFDESSVDYDIGKRHHVIDTFDIAESLYPGQKNNLDALNERLGIYRPRPYHRALIDAEITTDVYLSMLSRSWKA